MVKLGYEKDNINFEGLEFRPQFFYPYHQWDIYKSRKEASLREDLPNWKNEANPIISFCLIMSV
jgi:hypothetical protein